MKKIILLMLLLQSWTVFASDAWKAEWPKTDFSKRNVDLTEIISGGPPKDGIPAIDRPKFQQAGSIKNIADKEPVITVNINGDARSYPIRILIYHEIVNDTVGGVPVSITYCPLCNASIVFERTLNGQVLDFGTTGKLRHSDMVMYDRQSESWWQQFTGEGIVGKYTGQTLKQVPSRIESLALFKDLHPQGKVLVPNNPNAKPYGSNPYVQYDSSEWPFLFSGTYTGKVPPLSRVIAVGNDAWSLESLIQKKQIDYNGVVIRWQKGQHSPLDSKKISGGRDIGNVTVQKNGRDVPYHLPFAFAFLAFNKNGKIH
ncbi:MAG: hypothetical protein B0D92_07615 [Spirochaeta sp. LUC14_002_19_P3]|nr:MAG: hypothetical protein B0D92_07615 [Spirochaeta sp. LUC14_002_19_P3]